jgi:hypothetical protein
MKTEQNTDEPRLGHDEFEIAKYIGISVHSLRKDRTGPRRFPFYRVGGRILYNPDRVRSVMESMEEGGNAVKVKVKRA